MKKIKFYIVCEDYTIATIRTIKLLSKFLRKSLEKKYPKERGYEIYLY